MADVVFSPSCIPVAVGGYSIAMFRAELLAREGERLLEGYCVYKVVHLKERTRIGHEFCAVYFRKGNTFIVVRIERRSSMRISSSSLQIRSDDSISRLQSNFDARDYYHLSTTHCDDAKPLTVLDLCNVCAYIRHAAQFPRTSTPERYYSTWFCAAFLMRLSDLRCSTLQIGEEYRRRGRFGWRRFITKAFVGQELSLQLRPPRSNLYHTGKHNLSRLVGTMARPWKAVMNASGAIPGHAGEVNTDVVLPDRHPTVSALANRTVRMLTSDLEATPPAAEHMVPCTSNVRSVAFMEELDRTRQRVFF